MTRAARIPDPADVLADLNDEQRAAARCVRGPVVIMAGAGSGKTRVISRRAAYAAATGAVDPRRMLIVTFTEKAGAEMSRRITKLGLTGVIANNVHSVALRQLNYLWPLVHQRPAPSLLPSPYAIVNRFLRRNAPRVNARDVVAEISWAKHQAIGPERYLAQLKGREPGVDADLAARAFADYEKRKRAGDHFDFDDLLIELARLLRDNEEIGRMVRSRRNWICVDEYQDTNPIQDALFTEWLGDGTDFCVVGDPDQAIFGFTGASARYLTGFGRRYPGAKTFTLAANYRSSPQVLEAANRLLDAEGRSKRLVAVEPPGPEVALRAFPDPNAEVQAVVDRIRTLHQGGIDYPDIAVLFRQHVHKIPFERALSAARIPYVSAEPFFTRREVVLSLEALASPITADGLVATASATWAALFGFDPEDDANAGDARYDGVNALLGLARELARNDPSVTVADYVADIRRRTDEEANTDAGVELTTYHQAKGREWPAVFLPLLVEGTLPDFRAARGAARDEEWRLLYVGITRAERHLHLSHAITRMQGEASVRARRSGFLEPLEPRPEPATRRRSGGWRSGGRGHPRGRVSQTPTPAWPPLHSEPIRANSLIPADARVIHRSLGPGRVINVRGDRIVVTFDDAQHELLWPEVGTSDELRRDVTPLSALGKGRR